MLFTPSFVNPNNNRQGCQPRGNTKNQSYSKSNNGNSMNTHDTPEAHITNPSSEENTFHESNEKKNDAALANVTQHKPLPPGRLHRLISLYDTPSTTSPPNNNNITPLVNKNSTKCITLDGIKYSFISSLNLVYLHSRALTNKGSLVDRSANGEFCDTVVRLIEKTGRSVDIQSIDNHQITDVHIFISGVVFHNQRGPGIVIIHQYAYIVHEKISHLSGQL